MSDLGAPLPQGAQQGSTDTAGTATKAAPNHLRKVAIVILVVAVALRLYEVVQGYLTPFYPYQDEEAEVHRTLRLASGDLRPIFSNWGALPSYLLFFVYGLVYLGGRVLGSFSGTDDYLRLYITDPRFFILVGQLFYCIAGSALIFLVWKFARRDFGEKAGFLCLAIFAFLPPSVEYSRIVKPDILGVFLGYLSLYLVTHVGTDQDGKPPTVARIAWAGLALGVAVGTKLSLAPLGLGFLLALLLSSKTGRLRTLVTASAAVALGYVICNPFSVLTPGSWWFGEYGLFNIPGVGRVEPRKMQYASMHTPFDTLSTATGGPILAGAVLVATPIGFFLRSRVAAVLAATTMAYAAIFLSLPWFLPGHLLPVLPAAALLSGACIDAASKGLRQGPGTGACILAVVILVAQPSSRAFADARQFSIPDSQEESKNWITANIPEGSHVLVDCWYVPRLNRSRQDIEAELSGPSPVSSARGEYLRRLLRLDLHPAYRITVLSHRLRSTQRPEEQSHFNLQEYKEAGATFAVTSSGWTCRFFSPPFLPEDDGVRRFYEELRRTGTLLARFAPEDGRMIGPTIEVYRLTP